MKKLLLISSIVAFTAGSAFASGTHSGSHDEMMKVGVPGDALKVDRTVEVIMKETDDGDMIFEPNNLEVRQGETIRFVVRNTGELEHEFVLDEHEAIIEHKLIMEKFPEMEHDDPNAARLIEGTNGEIIWTFSNPGEFEFACLIPGHYEAGMKGSIRVTASAKLN